MAPRNCPFYGRALSFNSMRSFMLLERGNDQCALITDRIERCALEKDGKAVDWTVCPVLQQIVRGAKKNIA